jgi:hypothetical protein
MDLRDKKIDKTYDIPYTAGYSKDGKTIYIDRKMPEFLTSRYYDNQVMDVHKYLVHHEVTEKTFMDTFGYSYIKAHSLALAVEAALMAQDGVMIDEYYGLSESYYIANERLDAINLVPLDLDITPYLDDGREDLVGRILECQVAQRKGLQTP